MNRLHLGHPQIAEILIDEFSQPSFLGEGRFGQAFALALRDIFLADLPKCIVAGERSRFPQPPLMGRVETLAQQHFGIGSFVPRLCE